MERIRKPANELTVADFERFPVWEFASDEEGDPDQDESWVRPVQRSGALDPRRGDFLIRVNVVLADGARFIGFVQPPPNAQPVILTEGGHVSVPRGAIAPSPKELAESYARLGRRAEQAFSLTFESDVELKGGPIRGEAAGFLIWQRGGTFRVVR